MKAARIHTLLTVIKRLRAQRLDDGEASIRVEHSEPGAQPPNPSGGSLPLPRGRGGWVLPWPACGGERYPRAADPDARTRWGYRDVSCGFQATS